MASDKRDRWDKRDKRGIKFIAFLIYVTIFISITGRGQVAEAKVVAPKVSAHAYVVMDANSGKVLFSENKNKKIYPASTVKLMTAVVALENNKSTKNIKVSSSVLNRISGGASTVGLRAGKTYSFEQLLNLMLVASAADAAEELAADESGSTKGFINKMNQKAKNLGLSGTSFDNTVGLDIGNGYNHTYSTAIDIAKLARYAMANKQIRSAVSQKTYSLPDGFTVKSTNRFYSTAPYSSDRYSIIGTKTGTTNAAGHVLVSTARDKQGHEIICAFFGNVSRDSTYRDTRKLLDYTFYCHDEGKFSLSLNYYDVRFRKSEGAILSLCNKGVLKMSADGAFNPTDRVNQKTFINVINQVCNIDLVSTNKNKNMTVKDLSSIFYKKYPRDIPEKKLKKLNTKIDVSDKQAKEEALELAVLYDSKILPKEYINKSDAYITKEDMVIIAEKMREYIISLQEASIEEAS